MKLIKETYTNEIVINKSRFISYIYRVDNIDEVNLILQNHKKKYYDATHNCYAYIIGDNMQIQKASDDGEPSKTAGMPILDVLKKNNVTNILCVVTRYFGGILLGAGGLIRAYSESTASVLKKASFYELKKLQKLKLSMDYSMYNTILNKINKYYIIETLFLTNVVIYIGIDIDTIDSTIDYINNISKASINISIEDIMTIEVLINNL